MLKTMLENVRKNVPLIHNITNYVTVNDCANVLLACGSSPIMSDDVDEAEDITTICQGLNINIGTLNQRTIPAMIKAGKKANELGHPVILDPVGAGASRLRTETAFHLIDQIQFSVIRGNISEIKTRAFGEGTTKGVDADVADTVTEETLDLAVAFVKKYAQKTGAIVAVTGAIDIVADKDRAFCIRNGHPMMSSIHVGQSDMQARDVRKMIGDDMILGVSAETVEQAVEAEKNGADYLGVGAVLCKGGHSVNDANDLLYANGTYQWFKGKRIDNPNTHGTGCTLSSAVCSNLAKGYHLPEAVKKAKEYISDALADMLDLGKGSGPMNHAFDLKGRYCV